MSIGKEISAQGRVIEEQALELVHILLQGGGVVPAHDHVGQEVYFTLVKGEVELTLAERETHRLVPGKVLRFPGEHKVAVKALTDSEFFVYLINRR